MLNIPWLLESLPVQGLQVIIALSRVMDDLVGSFPCEVELSLDKVSSCWGDLPQDEVFYVKSSELHSLIVVLGYLLLVLRQLVGGFLSYFVYTIQVDS